jgi:alanine racemase
LKLDTGLSRYDDECGCQETALIIAVARTCQETALIIAVARTHLSAARKASSTD